MSQDMRFQIGGLGESFRAAFKWTNIGSVTGVYPNMRAEIEV